MRKSSRAGAVWTVSDESRLHPFSAQMAKLCADSGVIVITSFISPYRKDRALTRKLHEEVGLEFIKVSVDTPDDVCENRDPKGLYRKARMGGLRGLTGIGDPQ